MLSGNIWNGTKSSNSTDNSGMVPVVVLNAVFFISPETLESCPPKPAALPREKITPTPLS